MLSRVVELACHPAKVACFVVQWVAVNVVYLHMLKAITSMECLAYSSSYVDKHSLAAACACVCSHVHIVPASA